MVKCAVSLLLVCLLSPLPCRTADLPAADWPGGGRSELSIPDDVWNHLLGKVNHGGRALGYTASEMAFYGRDEHRLRTVENLFRDVRAIPRFGGRVAGYLVENAADPALVATRTYLLVDVSAGRMLPMPEGDGWGVEWIPEDASPADALGPVLARLAAGAPGERSGLRPRERRAWEDLPEPVQRLVVRLLIGAEEARPWVRAAYDEPFLRRAAGPDGKAPTREALYAMAKAPWDEDRLGHLATLRPGAFEALEKVDLDALGFSAVLYLTHVKRALDEYREATAPGEEGEDAEAGFPPVAVIAEDHPGLSLRTALGTVRVAGPGDDRIDDPAFLVVDLGGDDRYTGRHAVPLSLASPIATVVDLGGNDVYDGGEEPVAMACGLFGIGAIFDLAGNDRYSVEESGLGTAWYGTGFLMDFEGNDRYSTQWRWGQGTAHAGAGMLVDLSGDDEYECGSQSQGMGSTLGAGVLLDVEGNDRYVARDDGNVSELYLNQSVAMSQGVGYGRRADLGDGHSLAGGFGVLVDGAGDDDYHAQVWAQGAAYWWAVGILEDLGGDDTYRNGKYSSGAGAHFGIGSHADLSGDDRYNQGNDTAKNQFQAHARDGSIGVFQDGDGDDRYFFKSHSGGSGDLGSIGLFWDRRGNDRYEVDNSKLGDSVGWSDTPPMGTTTVYEPFHSFRDDLDAVGIFLDTGGEDEYVWEEGAAANDSAWPSNRAPNAWGYGLDARVYR